jgi:transaldolase
VETLRAKFPDFCRAYDEDGLSVAEFNSFAPTVRTLRQFLEATQELAVKVRDVLLPSPDVSAA